MIKDAIVKLVEGTSLSQQEAEGAMAMIMEGQATPAQLSAFLIALRMKGESTDEVLGMVRAMLAKSVPVEAEGQLVDTCGTGGDSSGTYNISTAAALVAAAAGLKVAKHGNRSASSQCGSADVLEALGVRISLTAAQVTQCLDSVSFAFLFAPAFHPAMSHAAPIRAEIGVRTVFNILGPMANPARPQRQVLGVARPELAPLIAESLRQLGTEHAMVVHGHDGLDEISLSAPTTVYEVGAEGIRSYTIAPEEAGLERSSRDALAGGGPEENARIVLDLFDGEAGPKRDALLFNAAATLVVGGKAAGLKDGVALAAATIDGGSAQRKLAAYVEFTQALKD
jgi:anthranilate phosphoribosyltransferase